MNREVAKDLVLIAAIGVAYYFVYTNAVGIAAAIAFPEWYVPFAQGNKVLSLVLFSLVTTVPAAALAALLAGFSIAKLVSGHRIRWGVAIVIGVTLYSILTLNVHGGFVALLTTFVLPSSVIDVPMIIAWWAFLPLSVALFDWRSKAHNE
jgi:hypothetical protein